MSDGIILKVKIKVVVPDLEVFHTLYPPVGVCSDRTVVRVMAETRVSFTHDFGYVSTRFF